MKRWCWTVVVLGALCGVAQVAHAQQCRDPYAPRARVYGEARVVVLYHGQFLRNWLRRWAAPARALPPAAPH